MAITFDSDPQEKKCQPTQLPIASEALEEADRLACKAKKIEAITLETLDSLMLPLKEALPENVNEPKREYPQFLDELRNIFKRIDNSLAVIDSSINRVPF